MTSKSPSEELQRSRYRVTKDAEVFVTIQRLGDDRPTASGTLSEISATSARISSNVPFQFGERLVICLAPEPMRFSISIGCNVQSIRNVGDDQWIIQCLFGSRLELSMLEVYMKRGMLERRVDERREVSHDATMLFEGNRERVGISLYDVGKGGFCFISSKGAAIGTRVRLFVEDGDQEIEARIMWQSEENNEYRIGCQWTNHKGVNYAKRFMQPDEPTSEFETPRTTSPLVHAVAIAIIAFYLGIFFSSGASSLVSLLQQF